MGIPRRTKRLAGRYALVDGVPFTMPVVTEQSPAIMAAFTIDAAKAKKLIPGNEIYPMRLWNKALLVIAVINYQVTGIGKYVEFSVAIACTQGKRPAARLLPGAFMKYYRTGQYAIDLPVSSEISVKGGKGIWGMPKHQANLNSILGDDKISSQYDLDGLLAMKIEIERPRKTWLPISVRGVNYCSFRGMLMKSVVYFKGKAGFTLFKKGAAKLTIGSHPRVQALKDLGISNDPIATVYIPEVRGVLDDHLECWFLTYDRPPTETPEGFESVIDLGLSQDWLDPPSAEVDKSRYTRTRE